MARHSLMHSEWLKQVSISGVTASLSIAIASLSAILSFMQNDIEQWCLGLILSGLVISAAGEHLLDIDRRSASWRVLLGVAALAVWLALGQIGVGIARLLAGGIALLYLGLGFYGALKMMGVSTSRALLSLASAFVAFSMGLVVLAVFDRTPAQGYVTHFLEGSVEPDADLGYVQTPHSIFRTYYPDNPEGVFAEASLDQKDDPLGIPPEAPYYVEYRNNAEGYRGQDYARPRLPGVYRIVVLGDSLTQGIGVPEEQTLCRQLETRLTKSLKGRQIEVINAGLRGLSTREERFHLEKRAILYEPQLVILAMYTNDNIFIMRENEQERSLPRWRWVMAQFRPEFGRRLSRCTSEAREIEKFCADRGINLVIVLFRYEPTDGLWSDLRRALAAELPHTPVLDVGDAILEQSRGRNLLVHPIDPHPNGLAHEIAAKSILAFLMEKRLIPLDDEEN